MTFLTFGVILLIALMLVGWGMASADRYDMRDSWQRASGRACKLADDLDEAVRGRCQIEREAAWLHKQLDETRAACDRAIKSAVKWHKACEAINDILKQTEEPTP